MVCVVCDVAESRSRSLPGSQSFVSAYQMGVVLFGLLCKAFVSKSIVHDGTCDTKMCKDVLSFLTLSTLRGDGKRRLYIRAELLKV